MVYLSSSIETYLGSSILSKGSLNTAPDANAAMGTADPEFFVLYPHHSRQNSSASLLCICCSLLPCLPCSIVMDTKTTSSVIISTFFMISGRSDLSQSSYCLYSIGFFLYFSFKLLKPWQWLVIFSKEVEVVGLKNVSVWCDSHSPSEIRIFFFRIAFLMPFIAFAIFMANLTGNRKIVSLLHCNMFSCLETSPFVLRTGCLFFSISLLQYKTYRLIYISLWIWVSISHTERCT